MWLTQDVHCLTWLGKRSMDRQYQDSSFVVVRGLFWKALNIIPNHTYTWEMKFDWVSQSWTHVEIGCFTPVWEVLVRLDWTHFATGFLFITACYGLALVLATVWIDNAKLGFVVVRIGPFVHCFGRPQTSLYLHVLVWVKFDWVSKSWTHVDIGILTARHDLVLVTAWVDIAKLGFLLLEVWPRRSIILKGIKHHP